MGFKPLAQTFYFDGYSIDPEKGRILYAYSTDAGHTFNHELTLDFPQGIDIDTVRPVVFALGMAELSHFWKATLAPKIVIRAGALSDDQITFWENLYTKGLGEFFYVNKIDFRDLVHIVSDSSAPVIAPTTLSRAHRALVPFGGGKDSLVTGELLKKQGKEFDWFELESLPFSKKLQEVSGTTHTVSVGRNVEKNFASLTALTKEGAPNGHTPITATYMLSAVLVAKLYGFSDVVLSLERSADEGNVEYLGMSVNHQYSKTLEFEKLIHNYVSEHIDSGIRVFSLLRGLYELQIVKEFVNYPQYFPYFMSCNRGLQTQKWCGECAKCAFMFSALSAFLSPETVVGIFHKNLFEDESLVGLYEELIGLRMSKPFDCVGTLSENLLALYLSGKRYTDAGVALPVVLQKLPIENGAQYLPMLEEKGDEHLIPDEYQI